MSRPWLLIAPLAVGLLAGVVLGRTPRPDDPKPAPKAAPKEGGTPANPENIEAALKLTVLAAAEYEFRVGSDEKLKPLELQREPVLKWSNPDRGEVHGNVFLWVRDGRPLMAGSLFKWFSPHKHMSHEFQSLSEEPFTAKFHGQEVWKTSEAGVKFVDVPKAPAPAAEEAQRVLQMKQLAKDFSGDKKEREDVNRTELRLLTQPLCRYSAPKQGTWTGGLFALVHGTDPEIWILIEARGKDVSSARWQYAAARMNGVEMKLRYRDEKVWSVETLTQKDIYSHEHAYTTFGFREIPDFLKDALAKPKP
jgi:hypothetical protein